MKRFVYAPDVEAYIQTDKGILDVSEDIISGSITRRINAVSSFELILQNPHRKYLETSLSPMNPVIIYLTRTKRMLAFSGYVDAAPIDQLYPEPVTITGSCTLKRLLYTYWNPQLPYVEQFLMKLGWSIDPQTGNLLDLSGKTLYNMDAQGSLGNMMQHLLHNVGGWDIGVNKKGDRVNTSKNSVQIMKLPKEFITVTQKILTAQKAGEQQYEASVTNLLNQLLTVNGLQTDPFGTGSASQDVTDAVTDSNPLPVKFKGRNFKAFTYGPTTDLSGFAQALQKKSKEHGEDLDPTQCQNASTIAKVFINKGFTAKAAAAFVTVAWHPESGLIANRVQGSDPSDPERATSGTPTTPSLVGYGLFQLTDTNGQWFGNSGYLAQAVKDAGGGNANPQRPTDISAGKKIDYAGAPTAYNPVYNAGARAISVTANDRHALNNSSNPIKLVCSLQNTGSVSGNPGPDYTQSTIDTFNIVWSAMQENQNTSSSTNNGNVSGAIGDVRVGDPTLINNQGNPQISGGPSDAQQAQYPWTFRIKPNPYNNPTNIFAAVKYDPSLKRDEISIWAPQDSNTVSQWKKGKEVTLETSLPGKPFPPAKGSSDNKDTGKAQGALNWALREIGKPYLWGGESPTAGFDCSGLVEWAYSKEGISLPHNAQLQFDQGPKVSNTDPLQPGDLIFFGGSTTSISHVGMVIDPKSNLMVDAPHTGADVRKENYPSSFGGFWGSDKLVGATRPAGLDNFTQVTSNQASGVGGASSGNGAISFTSQTFSQAVAAYGAGLPLVFPMAQSAAEAQLFTGERAYQDAQPLMNLVEFVCKSSGRNYISTPRGDFFAFYPDYFNWTKQTPYWVITDIETQDLTINFTDQPMATHVYTTADTYSAGSINITEELFSTVTSVESLGSFPDLVNARKNFNYTKFLETFGARPLNEEVVEIKNTFMQFMYGWMTFLEQWAKMFEANPTFTFMPELVPGGLVRFQSRDLTMYINEVTHNFDRMNGFTTTANLISPTTSQGHYALMVLNDSFVNNNA